MPSLLNYSVHFSFPAVMKPFLCFPLLAGLHYAVVIIMLNQFSISTATLHSSSVCSSPVGPHAVIGFV